MRKLIGLFGKLLISVLVISCFAVAAIIDTRPSVGPASVPTAYDVRSGLILVSRVEAMLASDTPLPMRIDKTTMAAVHSLVGYAKDDLRIDAVFENGYTVFRISRQVAPSGWVNAGVVLTEKQGSSVPQLSVRLGAWGVPQTITDTLVKVVIRLIPKDQGKPASFADLIPSFKADKSGVQADVLLPKHVVGGMRALLNPLPDIRVDSTRTREIYARLLHHLLISTDRDYPTLIALAAQEAHGADGLRETITALNLLTDGMRTRRFMGERTATALCPLRGEDVTLYGREDLPKHWTLSANLALYMGPRVARAAGVWKEMADSLPGGTGFSFVDLGADYAGVTLGTYARDIDDDAADKLLTLMRAGRSDIILPAAVIKLPEAIPHDDFIKNYKGLDQPQLLAAEGALYQMLAQSPLYRSRF